MPKILNVVCVFFSIPSFFGDQLSYFTKKGYNIHLSCSSSNKLFLYAKERGCSAVEIQIDRKFSIWQDLIALWKLYNYIKKEKFDIVSGHTPKGGLLSMIAAYIAGVHKRIFFRHGLVYETKTGISRLILINAERVASLLATKVVCVSPYLIERSLQDHLTSKEKMILLNIGSCNGVDALGKFNPNKIIITKKDSLKQALQIDNDSFVIGYTGRLVKDKGIVELVEAFQTLDKQYNNLRLLLVGPLEERDALPNEIVQIIKNHPRIIFTGLIEDNIQYYYSLMDILVLCTHREGFGTSILEASSMEKPVLTTSHSGSRDAIINEQTGYYIEMTATSLIEKISFYINNPEIKFKHGMNGRSFVLKNFEQEIIWEEIENRLYKN